jgi:ketosteroid isomerase-like protein
MTRLTILLLTVAAAAGFAADPADAVREASAGWRNGAIKKDAAALQRFLADDLGYSHANGKTQTKAEYIDSVLKTGHYESFTDSDTKIAIYGRAAVLRGFVDVKVEKQEPYRVLTLEVYVQNNGQWQMAAHQSVRINAPNGKQ